ncbi:hypothetical protein CHU98_g12356 [Xylaria longipes]|nr:hypothetical protein CHU98_g12356 [Xylaria longipes]
MSQNNQSDNYKQGYSNYTTATHEKRTAESSAGFLIPHIKATDHILDVGCGPGTITRGFAKYAHEGVVIGLDMSADVLEKAKRLADEAAVPTDGPGSVRFEQGNVLEGLPYPDDTFDIVYCSQVLGHIPPPDLPRQALVEMRRVLKPGGILASRDGLASFFYPTRLHLDRLWSKNLRKMVRQGVPDDVEDTSASLPAFYRAAGFDTDGGKSWLDVGISKDEMQETLRAVNEWAETEDAWFAAMQCEMLAWKYLCRTPIHDTHLSSWTKYTGFILDYYEFTLIERAPNRTFDLFDVALDALSNLEEICLKYLEEASSEPAFDHVIPSGLYLHGGNRNPSRKSSPRESRIISRISADLESRGVVTKIPDYEPPCTEPMIIRGVDREGDLYFHYDLGVLDEQAFVGSALDVKPSENNLIQFCDSYKLNHPNAVFAKGSIHVHYCAWPIPMPRGPQYAHLNFSTPEAGQLYRWKALPFDMPLALHIWKFWVDRIISSKLPFVRLVQTTLVICAENLDSAEANQKTLTGLGEDHGWSFSIPSPSSWMTNARNLGLGFLQKGCIACFVDGEI